MGIGWLRKDQVALHRAGNTPKVYNLQLLNAGNIPGRLKAVMIPGETAGRDTFGSAIRVKANGKNNPMTTALTLHLGNPSSNRVVTFGNQTLSFRGLTFEGTKHDDNFVSVKRSPFVAKK